MPDVGYCVRAEGGGDQDCRRRWKAAYLELPTGANPKLTGKKSPPTTSFLVPICNFCMWWFFAENCHVLWLILEDPFWMGPLLLVLQNFTLFCLFWLDHSANWLFGWAAFGYFTNAPSSSLWQLCCNLILLLCVFSIELKGTDLGDSKELRRSFLAFDSKIHYQRYLH